MYVCTYVRTFLYYNRYKRGPQERSAGVGSVSLCTEDSTAIYFQQKGSHRDWFVTPFICNVYTIVPYVRIFFIYVGVEVLEGSLRLNTMMTIPAIGLDVGRITRIENNHKEATSAKKGTQVRLAIYTWDIYYI